VSLARIDEFIRAAVARAQESGHDPTDALRGLIISHDEVADYLGQTPLSGFWADGNPAIVPPSERDADLPFLQLIATFNLNALDSYILLLCLAPEFDRRYERLYAYLQDDVSQRRPTVNLMMNLLGGDVAGRFAVWERLAPTAPLRKFHLIEAVPDPGRHNPVFLGYHLKVDHRVVAHLLGDTTPDERLKHAIRLDVQDTTPTLPDAVLEPVFNGLKDVPLVFMQGGKSMGQVETAAALCAAYNLPLVSVDLAALTDVDTPFDTGWRLALREAYLSSGALLLDSWESALSESHHQPDPALWDALVNYPRPVFICAQKEWEPLDTQRTRRMLRLTFGIPPYPDRYTAWEQFTRAQRIRLQASDVDELAGKFRFTRSQIARAVNTATDIALSRGESATKVDLYAGAQAHASLQLGSMARRIVPRYEWDDLVLPPDQLTQLREISFRMRFAHMVNDTWGFGHKIVKSRGTSVLFAGESGTGKTLAAEVLARDLGLVLYKIDLSAVVSKYIGETEKNLSVIFTEAQSSNAVLFFDEADALFGKRSEVKDARDRYANIEVAYLLQQIESYDGMAILATNLRQNLDEAFTRRLDFLIDFPFPEAEYRQKIWAAHFPPEVPLSPDVNLGEIAERYPLAGGNIRNAALAAAYLAAADGKVITPIHIRNAIRREHQKMGRLLSDH
jgi:hypothetical protein